MVFVVEALVSALLSASFQVLFDRLSPRTNLFEFLRRHEFNVTLLENLKTTLLQVNAVLSDAEEKQITNRFVREWVDELKDAVYHTADLLDEIHFLTLAESRSTSTSSALNSIVQNSKYRLEKMTSKLENIAKHKDVLGLEESFSGKPSPILQLTSLVDEFEVHGRRNDKEKIMDFLLSGSVGENEIPVVAIIGIAGVGKTTLTQVLYNDRRVKTHFRTRAWVYVSEDFDVFKVTKTIYESVTLQPCGITDLNILQVKLKKILMTRKKFLIVLDDVWNEYYSKWDALRSFLKVGASESRIIVTTRNQGVAQTTRAIHICHLQPLEDEYCWLVFANHAFGSPQVCAPPKLKSIAQQIMKKCRGLPLAAKVMGSLLYSKVEAHEWINILNSNIWDLPKDKSDILPSLRLSYYHLSSHLKQCFAYCSIFSKGYVFGKEKLVLLWMAEGFLPQPRSDRTMEEVGIACFNELLSKSFFQQASDYDKSHFIMHDLIHELAQFASSESCFRFERGKSHGISNKVRHFSYVRAQFDDGLEKFDALKEAEFLRTFLPLSSSSSGGLCSINRMVVSELLPRQKRLRVLSLSHYGNINTFPNDFGKLIHLRYLDFSHNAITKLPSSIGFLYNLQTLILSHCIQLSKLPATMRNLINLGHLDLNGAISLKMMPPEFGKLKSLQILTNFVVSNITRGSSISELGVLLKLRGKLSISGLQNVGDAEEVENANLKDKKDIKELEFSWSSTGPANGEAAILEKLSPHENIEKLSIRGYGDTELPNWLGDPKFSNMVILHLTDCRNCLSLPSLGQLPSLQELHVKRMALESINPEFYGNSSSSIVPFASLRILKFEDMPNWIHWSSLAVTEGREFPLLQELHIQKCENLIEIPNCLPSLELLFINECWQLQFDDFMDYPALQSLSIRSCNYPTNFTLNFSSNLKFLQIQDCRYLRFLEISEELHQQLNFFEDLEISECPNLELFSGNGLCAPNLTTFSVSNCNNLSSMPEQMHVLLTSLQNLNISGCPRLVSFPDGGLPLSLQKLVIQNCISLTLQNSWGLTDMASLTCLTINCAYQNVTSFPDEGLLPASLTFLQISEFPMLETLNLSGLQHLTLLEDLQINCSRLQILSEGRMPDSLSSLSITGSPSMTDLCQQNQGIYWDKISHIPFKFINGNEIR
ncbi:hypothetical protein JRO89_XS05G0138000 [Xanthoceras sorbifolium]|uniref:Disease resistance RPP13-like protein 1 n=1 Tax=Xanthoceras sorbifolium TaxID=99658 RepID=A0ABQ8I1R6_9ROSI|nr:hypothetical protein JRO89_XS05G0138000 [Xanthoceras sorbifolium]